MRARVERVTSAGRRFGLDEGGVGEICGKGAGEHKCSTEGVGGTGGKPCTWAARGCSQSLL